MRLEISHATRYVYDRTVRLNSHLVYLRPSDYPMGTVESFTLTTTPEAEIHWMLDDFDNLMAHAEFSAESQSLEILTRCIINTTGLPPFNFLVRDYATQMPFEYEPLHRYNLSIYLAPPPQDTKEALIRWLDERFIDRPLNTVGWLFELNKTVQRCLRYQRRDELGIQSSDTTMQLESGSCRDFAVLLIECARSLGLAARFVSGYMCGVTGDPNATDMHAWAEIFLPGAGWIGLDPTHGIFCDDSYVPVAHAVVAESVNPVQGSFYSSIPASSRLTTQVSFVRQTP